MRPKHSKARETYIDKYTKALRSRIENIQNRYYSTLLEQFVSNLQTNENGQILSNAFNRRLVRKITSIHTDFVDDELTKLLGWLIRRLEGLNNINRKYYDAMSPDYTKKIAEKNEKSRFDDLGYENEKIKKDSYLYDVQKASGTLESVKQFAVRAVAAGITYAAFKNQFRTLIKGNDERLGTLVRNVFERIGETFTIQDRELAKGYSSDLDLNFFIFNGPDLPNSREFCLTRKGKVFTRAEVESWRDLNWKGKNDNYNPFRDVGGHNCVDVLDPITEELAIILRPDVQSAA